MKARSCQQCGAALPERGRGRTSVYCSAACRQRAYRDRHAAPDQSAADVLADIERRVKGLALEPAQAFRADAEALATASRRLWRMARNVTPEVVTKSVEVEEGAPPPRLDDETEFAALVEPHRKWLHLHCYRMVGSYDDAEDLVQETLLKAWRDRSGFQGRAAARTWLYRIATNACIDHLRRTGRQPQKYAPVPGFDSGPGEPPERLAWLQPYPDQILDEAAGEQPEAAAVSRETMELVFLAALQHLPPRQRAVLIFRDVLGRPADETATLMDMSVAASNSALQRARQTLRDRLPQRRTDWAAGSHSHSQEEREIVRRYMAAAERADVSMMADLLAAGVVVTMPPNPMWFAGRDALVSHLGRLFDTASPAYFGRWRHLPTWANRQPAVAGYVQRPGTSVYRAQMVDVLRIEAGRIIEITTFEAHLVAAFGLPLTLPADGAAGHR